MAVPDFKSLMLPFLKIMGDGKERHVNRELPDILAKEFNLTKEDLNEMIPSGRYTKFDNRIGWIRTYFKKAGLITNTARGKYRITERGLEVLKSKPSEINSRFLKQFPEFAKFSQVINSGPEPDPGPDEGLVDPEETLDSNYRKLRQVLADDLVEKIKGSSSRFFEKLVVDLLLAMGYGGFREDAGQVVGKSGDGGIDGIIKQDKLGLDQVYVQAKLWENTVGRPVIQAFAGSLEGNKARKGIIITTSDFSQEAKDYVKNIEKKIILIDGERLADLMIEHNVGVTKKREYILKQIDSDYFEEE